MDTHGEHVRNTSSSWPSTIPCANAEIQHGNQRVVSSSSVAQRNLFQQADNARNPNTAQPLQCGLPRMHRAGQRSGGSRRT